MSEDKKSEPAADGEAATEGGEFDSKEATPGYLVRSERERQAMSLDELAANASLSSDVVEALEGNQFDALPDRVYVRGYYRKCARALAMPEQTLVDAYTRCSGVEDPHAALESHVQVKNMPRDASPRGSFSFKWLFLVALLVIAGLLVWAWLPGIMSMFSGRDAGNVAVIDTPSVNAGGDQIDGESHSGKPQRRPAHADNNAKPDIFSNTSATTTQKPALNRGADHAGQDGTQTVSQKEIATTKSQNEQGSAATSHRLVLKFQQRSWVRVRDSSGTTLISGLIAGGEKRVLTGQPPYEVELGYAPGVAVIFGGESVDLSSYIEADNTAELTLRPGSQ